MNKVVIYGNGKTGKALESLLEKQHISYCLYNDKDGFNKGESFEKKTVIVSPGVHPQAKGRMKAIKSGCKVVGELEYCWKLCKGKIISVTGTNGKTTTCQMIQQALQSVISDVPLLGNGGIPFCSKVLDIKSNQYVVLESSSFMLQDALTFAPYISVFTNFAEDHLDYHASFANYMRAKCNNFIHQGTDNWAIFNKDDCHLEQLAKLCKCNALFYSCTDKSANCYLENDYICVCFEKTSCRLRLENINRFSQHNISNLLAAILSCAIVGIDLYKAVEALSNFMLLPHRMQLVGQIGNVAFIDDSKATNVHATQSALQCYDCPIALIVGGSDKNAYYDPIFENLPKNVVTIAAYGDTAVSLYQSGKRKGIEIQVLDSLEACTLYCFDCIKGVGGVVLMSNACASFDFFNSYEQRGEYFCRVVKGIEDSFCR